MPERRDLYLLTRSAPFTVSASSETRIDLFLTPVTPQRTISCTLTVCLLLKVTATVELLIPTYGFCVPPRCPTVGAVLRQQSSDLPSQGPCASEGFLPILEINCIEVDKVYDSRRQTVMVTDVFVADDCTPTECDVDLATSSCAVVAITPTSTPNVNNITFAVGIEYEVFCSGVTSPITRTVYTTVTVPLYNPVGTIPSCTILSATCSCVNLPRVC